jgi:hypothetical protein
VKAHRVILSKAEVKGDSHEHDDLTNWKQGQGKWTLRRFGFRSFDCPRTASA